MRYILLTLLLLAAAPAKAQDEPTEPVVEPAPSQPTGPADGWVACLPDEADPAYGLDCVEPPQAVRDYWKGLGEQEPPEEPEEPTDPEPPAKPVYAPGDWKDPAPINSRLEGTSGNDVMRGTAKNDHFKCLGGSDTMTGLAGDDFYDFDGAGDTIVEKPGEGIDTAAVFQRNSGLDFVAPDNVERIIADRWKIQSLLGLIGNASDNVIVGNPGPNRIDGRGGKDKMSGGAGKSTFILRAGETNGDWIDDLKAGDVIELHGFGAGAKLTNEGDVWTVSYGTGKAELFKVRGVTSKLAASFK